MTTNGVLPNDSKVCSVKEFPRPVNVKEVKSFLGLVNYYRRHMKDHATVAHSLTTPTQEKTGVHKLEWTNECEETFMKVKQLHLCSNH